MPIPSPARDHLFVQVDATSLDRTPSGLYIPDWQPGDKDAQQAMVVAVPQTLTGRTLGFPLMDGLAYAYRDLVDLPRVGDTVYLKPNTFAPHWEYPGHPGVFLVALDKVIAVSEPLFGDDSLLRPFQGLLLCDQVYDDDVYMGPTGVRERLKPVSDNGAATSFITEVDPLPQPFVLRVEYAGRPLRGQDDYVKAGDVIVAHRSLFAYHAVKQKDNEEASARWCWQPSSIIIDGHEYAFVPRQCVMAKLEVFTKVHDKQTGITAQYKHSPLSERLSNYGKATS